MRKFLAHIDIDKAMKNGSRRFYIDVDKSLVSAFFSEIGIPTGDNPIPVYISSAEYPESTSDVALGIPNQPEGSD